MQKLIAIVEFYALPSFSMSDIGKVGKCWEWVICLNASRSGILGSTRATSFRGKSDGPGCDDDETSIDEPLLSAARRHRVRFFRCSLRSTLLLLGCRATFNFVINRLLSSRTRASECWTERSAWLLKFAKRAFSYSQSPSRSLFRRIQKTELDLFNYIVARRFYCAPKHSRQIPSSMRKQDQMHARIWFRKGFVGKFHNYIYVRFNIEICMYFYLENVYYNLSEVVSNTMLPICIEIT